MQSFHALGMLRVAIKAPAVHTRGGEHRLGKVEIGLEEGEDEHLHHGESTVRAATRVAEGQWLRAKEEARTMGMGMGGGRRG